MTGFITALTDSTNGISASSFWSELTPMVPLLIILVPFAFGYRILRKSIKGSAKAKANI